MTFMNPKFQNNLPLQFLEQSTYVVNKLSTTTYLPSHTSYSHSLSSAGLVTVGHADSYLANYCVLPTQVAYQSPPFLQGLP